MNNQTQSHQSPSAPLNASPAPGHIEKFIPLMVALEGAIDETPAPAPSDPEFGKYIDTQALLQQCALIQHFNSLLEVDDLDYRAASNLRQTLALLEKACARHERKNAAKTTGPDQPERDEARHFLQSELSRGERSAKELFQISRSIGIAPATLKRAKASMNIISTQRHHPDRCWMWSIPTPAPTSSPDFPDSQISALVPPVSTGGADATTAQAQRSNLVLPTTLSSSSHSTQPLPS